MEDEIISFLKSNGFQGLGLLILAGIIIGLWNNPDRVKTIVLYPFHFIKLFRKKYAAAILARDANQFFQTAIFSQLAQEDSYSIKVKWVEDSKDPVLGDGELILRIRDEDDHTRNILTAVHTALPNIICPLIRGSNISSACEKSIDLAILKKLANKLGGKGKLAFKKYFLDPESKAEADLKDIMLKLHKLDSYGIFMPIFIHQLDCIGTNFFAENDASDYTPEILRFIDFLTAIADREISEHIELNHLQGPFKVSVMLLALSYKAHNQGTQPYLKRLRTSLDLGCKSLYVISFPVSFGFYDRLVKILRTHASVYVKRSVRVNPSDNNAKKIAVLESNDLFLNEGFENIIKEFSIKEGNQIIGIVDDISNGNVSLNVHGLRGYIKLNEASWVTPNSCHEIFSLGQKVDCVVISVDNVKFELELSCKRNQIHPWGSVTLPALGDTIEIQLTNYDSTLYRGVYKNVLEVYFIKHDLSWYLLSNAQLEALKGQKVKAKIVKLDAESRMIFCSIRELEANPWPVIHQTLNVGMEFSGKVSSIDVKSDRVQVMLPNGFIGIINKSSFEKAGFEYADWRNSLVVGQGLSVYISKVFIDRKLIRLELTRNRN